MMALIFYGLLEYSCMLLFADNVESLEFTGNYVRYYLIMTSAQLNNVIKGAPVGLCWHIFRFT